MPSSVLAGRYELRDRIGAGGMATVWRGFDRRLGREVAVKVLSEPLAHDERFRQRFEREARHIAALTHPNIVVVHDSGMDGDRLFIVMELVRGKTLRDMLADSSRLRAPFVASLASDILKGLGHAHDAGILHRDIKPANILITDSGVSKLADFGIAIATEETFEFTNSGAIMATIPYASPEQLAGRLLGPQSDLYSLGCVLYECLSGRLPFRAELAALNLGEEFYTPASLRELVPETPVALSDTIERALEKDPEKRPATAKKMASAIGGGPLPPQSPHGDGLSHNIPSQLTSFIGRERELAEVGALISEYRLVTLTGTGGTGKTRLALRVAAEQIDGIREVWLVDLAPLSDPEVVAGAVASVIGALEEPGRPLSETIVDVLRQRDMLLVLDNCEHLIDSCAKLADAVLRSCPNVNLLATSREQLGVGGERVFRVPSMTLPPEVSADVTIDELLKAEAVRLFAERARSHRPDFHLSMDNAAAVVSICRQLDGGPLAIELATARLRSMAITDIETRLDQRFRLLTSGSRTALPRQRTLGALIDWSFELLDDLERTVLCRLSVFVGGWDLDSAEAVCSGEDLEVFKVADLIGSLVDKNLVQTDPTAFGLRYRLLETIRQYASERLTARGKDEQDAVHAAHARSYLAMAERAAPELRGPDVATWLELLDVEHDNLRAAIDHLLADPDEGEGALRFVNALHLFWRHRHTSEGLEEVLAALNHPGALEPTELRAAALCEWGTDNYRERRPFLEEGLKIAQQLGNPELTVELLNNLAWSAYQDGDPEAFYDLSDKAVALARTLGSMDLLGRALERKATATRYHVPRCRTRPNLEEARTLFKEALTCLRASGDRISEERALCNLGALELTEGNLDEAHDLYEAALTIALDIRDVYTLGAILGNKALLRILKNDFGGAQNILAQALRIAIRTGSRIEKAYPLLLLAVCASRTNRPHDAAVLHGAAGLLFEQTGMPCDDPEAGIRDEDLSHLRRLMGDAFEATYQVGRTMTSASAIDFALDNLERPHPTEQSQP